VSRASEVHRERFMAAVKVKVMILFVFGNSHVTAFLQDRFTFVKVLGVNYPFSPYSVIQLTH
jgi:hypothetical protein